MALDGTNSLSTAKYNIFHKNFEFDIFYLYIFKLILFSDSSQLL